MANQIPVINYIIQIVDDTCYWINITMEHLVILNELLKEEEVNADKSILEELNEIYSSMEHSIQKLDDLEKNALYGEPHQQVLMNLGNNALKELQVISGVEVQYIQLLGRLEELKIKNLYLLIISHITLEERYSLEMLSGHINKITGVGFPD